MLSSSLLYSEFITHYDITLCVIVHDVTNTSYIIYSYTYTYMIKVFGRLRCTYSVGLGSSSPKIFYFSNVIYAISHWYGQLLLQ